ALERALARLTPVRRPAEGKGAVARLKGWFARPVKGRIVRDFGRGKGEKFARNGVIFSARPGETVLAAQDGVVLYSGWFKGYGQMLVLDHGSSLLSVYAHLERLLRKPGDGVLKSDPIGRAGDTGSTEGPGLYFEIRLRGQALDPVAWMRSD
ncbi:MAG: peptidoglycan DD-metalloendopeptidase family protein, partial [Candidatus Methylomirabilis sp.]|nr:peptidoglycan DD-metalloendopeptidase family protein [Deltaproteobacteria bacterium]